MLVVRHIQSDVQENCVQKGLVISREMWKKESMPSTHWIRGGVRPRAGLDAMESRKIVCPLQGIEPWPPDL